MACMKVDPKSLGMIQVLVAAVIFMFGFTCKNFKMLLSIQSQVALWGSACFLASGALSAGSMVCRSPCLVKFWLSVNLASALSAVVAIIMFALDMKEIPVIPVVQTCDDLSKTGCQIILGIVILHGTFRVLLVLSILEVCMSIWSFVLIWNNRPEPAS